MFEVENLNEFINRMFENAVKSKSDVKEGLITFRKYLADTSMCDDAYLKKLDKIIECSGELLALKKKMNNFDVAFFVDNAINSQVETVVPNKKKKTPVRRSNTISDTCGGSSVNSRCGTINTYSDSCGGGGGYSNRC